MKKRKFNLLLEIATLCLCVAAIAFGVYSAKTASLNITGTIGFEAHNCEVGVVAQLSGDGVVTNTEGKIVASPDGNVRRTALDVTANFATVDKGTITFGDLYFADMDTVNGKAAPIKMTFTITNNSAFSIKASVTLPNNNNDVTVLANKDSIKIEQGTYNTGEITLTFTLNNPETTLATALDLSSIKFDFMKFETKKSDIEVKYTETALIEGSGLLSNYYIQYGTSTIGETTYNLNWFIIGTLDTDGQLLCLSETTDLLDTFGDGTYRMKDEITYAFLSDYILSDVKKNKKGDYCCIPFNNNVIAYDEKGSNCLSKEYPEIKGNDYSVSTVRAYLNGESVCTDMNFDGKNFLPDKTGVTRNFYKENTLKNSDIYTLIKPRTLSSLYKAMRFWNEVTYDVEIGPVDVPVNVEGISNEDSDAFWLLSLGEVLNIDNDNGDYLGNYTVTLNRVSGGWWTRTPKTRSISYGNRPGITSIPEDGGWYETDVWTYQGVRPAFLI